MAWSFLQNDLVTFRNGRPISSILGDGLAASPPTPRAGMNMRITLMLFRQDYRIFKINKISI